MAENNRREEYELHQVRKSCAWTACPSIYELKKACFGGTCPSIHADKEDDNMYYVIGTVLSGEKVEKLGLAGKVGKGEVAMAVPKSLLEGL